MSSENEIIEQAGDEEPVNNTDTEAGTTVPEVAETAVEPSSPPENERLQSEMETLVETTPEADADELEGEEPDWDAWLLANPEEEEIPPAVEPEEEIEISLLGIDVAADDEPLADDVEGDLVEVIIAEFEEEEIVEIVEKVEELEVLLEEVDEMDAAIEAAAEAYEQETVAEAIVEAEAVADHMPEDAIDTEPLPVDEPVAEAVVAPPAKPKKPKKHPQGLTTKDVIRYFAPCGRCGYFLTGYRAAYGLENFKTAVSEEKDGWLSLSWGNDIRELLLKSYGRVVESNDLIFNSACPECRRVLIYTAASDEDQPAVFRIEIKPESGH